MSAAAAVPSGAATCEPVAVLMVVRNEPLVRVRRAVDALAMQRAVDPFTVVIAAPAADLQRLRLLEPNGSVRMVRLVHNEGGSRSAGLNAAARAADAEIVVRVDARSVVRDDYVARCVARLVTDHTVGVVGGVQRPEAYSGRVRERGIVRALRNRWLLGNADYRRPGAGGATDTVYLGAFRADELLALGGYDERLDANEDFDLCARYRADGRVVWLEPNLLVGYEPRSTVVGVARQYHSFGVSKVRFWRSTGGRPNTRQRVALVAGTAAAIAVLAAGRRVRPFTAVGATVVGALAVVDHIADPHERDLRVRATAWLTSAVAATSWLTGVADELVSLRGSAGRRMAIERKSAT
jgi:succinoglycan biosynthesis protein ExoA